MPVLGGGMWGGIAQGLKDMDDRALEQKKMDAMDADIAARNRAADVQTEQLGMQKDLHQVKMDEVKRSGRIIDIDAIGKTFGTKDPSAYEYGLDHATRNGYIIVDPATGKRGIRADDLQKTMAHLDSAQGVEQVSKRNIVMLTDQLKKAKDPAEIQTITERLNIEKQYNDKAAAWQKHQDQMTDKEKDRQAHLQAARINKAPGADKPGEADYRAAHTELLREQAKGLREGGSDKGRGEAALAKYLNSDGFIEDLNNNMPKDLKGKDLADFKRKRAEELTERFVANYIGGREKFKQRLGGSPATSAPPVPGARQGKDGNWYVIQNGKPYRVEK